MLLYVQKVEETTLRWVVTQ